MQSFDQTPDFRRLKALELLTFRRLMVLEQLVVKTDAAPTDIAEYMEIIKALPDLSAHGADTMRQSNAALAEQHHEIDANLYKLIFRYFVYEAPGAVASAFYEIGADTAHYARLIRECEYIDGMSEIREYYNLE